MQTDNKDLYKWHLLKIESKVIILGININRPRQSTTSSGDFIKLIEVVIYFHSNASFFFQFLMNVLLSLSRSLANSDTNSLSFFELVFIYYTFYLFLLNL